MSFSALKKRLGFTPKKEETGDGLIPRPVSSVKSHNKKGTDPAGRPMKIPGTPESPGPEGGNPGNQETPKDGKSGKGNSSEEYNTMGDDEEIQFRFILRSLIGLDEEDVNTVNHIFGVTRESEAFALTKEEWISYNEQTGYSLTPLHIVGSVRCV